ncbi:MAG: hypothetical protein ACI4WS_10955 [Oscillospiraceae bacterium]
MEQQELPLGLGMALAQYPEALQRFADLPEERKQEIINGTHSVTSKKEMRRYVSRALGLGEFNEN